VKVISHRPRSDLFHWPLLAALILWLLEKALIVVRQSAAASQAAEGKVRVDPLTGKLEVI